MFRFSSFKDIPSNEMYVELSMCIEGKGDKYLKKDLVLDMDELYSVFLLNFNKVSYLIKFSNEKYINKEDETILHSKQISPNLSILHTNFLNIHDLTCLLKYAISYDIKKNANVLYTKALYYGYPSIEDIKEKYDFTNKHLFLNKIFNEETYTKEDIVAKMYNLFILKYFLIDDFLNLVAIIKISDSEIDKMRLK